jgi:hypothetical protein
MDDPELASHLARRAGSGAGAIQVADSVRSAVATERQRRHRPWDRWQSVPTRSSLRWVGASAAILVVAALAGAIAFQAPVGTIASQSASPRPVSTAEIPTFVLRPWSLDLAGLSDAVATTRNGGSGGRIVVANVSYELAGSDPNCRGTGVPDCVVVVSGSNPPIHVRDTQNASTCPSTWFCTMELMPLVPDAGPAALRLRQDGDVEYIGIVREPGDGRVGFSETEMSAALAKLAPDDLDAYRLYVVSGWLSQGMFEPKCLQISSDPNQEFSCGRAAWLSDTDDQPNQVGPNDYALVAPSQAIRLPNESYTTFAPGPPWAGLPDLLEPRYGTFLVRPVVPVPTSCFACGDATAEVVDRLDPPLSQPPASAPGPTASPVGAASVGPESPDALAYAKKFEQSRATGDWQEAWLLPRAGDPRGVRF